MQSCKTLDDFLPGFRPHLFCRQSSTVFLKLVSPPSAQCFTWCASVKRLAHPGKRHPRSRSSNARRMCGGIVRVLRPTLSRDPSFACTIATTAASHAMRRDVSAETRTPSRSERPGSPSAARVAASQCTITW